MIQVVRVLSEVSFGWQTRTHVEENLLKPSLRLKPGSLGVDVSCICLSHLWGNGSAEAPCHQGHMKAVTEDLLLVTEHLA